MLIDSNAFTLIGTTELQKLLLFDVTTMPPAADYTKLHHILGVAAAVADMTMGTPQNEEINKWPRETWWGCCT